MRIQLAKNVSQPHGPRYSAELYRIKTILDNDKPALFKLATDTDPEIKIARYFYGRQLALVKRHVPGDVLQQD